MIHQSVVGCIGRTPLVYLRQMFPQPDYDVIAKLELLNPGGSIKDRPARYIIEQGMREGTIRKDSHLIESSSGNMGIALAIVARHYSLPFTCVVDPKTQPTNLHILQNLGARIEMVHDLDDENGYLKTRIRRVQELLKTIPNSIWANQYANAYNWLAHYHGTAAEIVEDLDRPIDCLVCAVSTTGTLTGIARRLRQEYGRLRVIAVDAVGSVIFGGASCKREIPGLGSSRVPEILCREEVDEVVHVHDWEIVQACHTLAATEGIFAGGSSGAVMAAIQHLGPTFPRSYRVLTLCVDRGERYLDTIYDDVWAARVLANRKPAHPKSERQTRSGLTRIRRKQREEVYAHE